MKLHPLGKGTYRAEERKGVFAYGPQGKSKSQGNLERRRNAITPSLEEADVAQEAEKMVAVELEEFGETEEGTMSQLNNQEESAGKRVWGV